MSDFKRALCFTLAAVVLVIVLVLGFELINNHISESGFSSGAVFVFEHGEDFISGEIFGRSFSANTAPIKTAFSYAEKLFFLLPPPAKFLIRIFTAYL